MTDDTGMMWRWADVGSGQMPRAPPMYPTKTIGTGGAQQPATSQVDYTALYRWILGNLAWLSQYDTVYVFVGNRELPIARTIRITGPTLLHGSRAGVKS